MVVHCLRRKDSSARRACAPCAHSLQRMIEEGSVHHVMEICWVRKGTLGMLGILWGNLFVDKNRLVVNVCGGNNNVQL